MIAWPECLSSALADSCPCLARCNHVTGALRWRYIIEGGLLEKNHLHATHVAGFSAAQPSRLSAWDYLEACTGLSMDYQ